MNIESIFELWNKDSEIDNTELADEVLKIPKLHNKYYQIFIKEKIILKQYELSYKKLKLEKHEFYTQGPNEYSKSMNWQMPSRGMILKTDIPLYIDGDTDLNDSTLKIGIQQEKVNMLESIIKSFNNRGYAIKSAIEWIKFTNGA